MKEVTVELVVSVVNEVMEDVEITMEKLDDNLVELGMDSIDFIQIVVSLETKFECEIPESKLSIGELNTINKMLDILQTL